MENPCSEGSIINQSKKILMKAGATSEHKGDIYEPGTKCKGKGKEESSKVMLPVNEEVRN